MPEALKLPIDHPILVSDFDGTMTRHDFFQLVGERLAPPGTERHWDDYVHGRITHFDALARTFADARADESAYDAILAAQELDPDLAAELAALRAAGWEVVVISNGCLWYIERHLVRAGVEMEVYANPGRLVDGRLIMDWPTGSRFFSPETGIDKAEVVRAAQEGGRTVAFAGDGRPDLAPALLVPPDLRFARSTLAELLRERGEPFRPYERWAEVARALRGESR
jgi:2,3-diketo-5-methylthio-1-phosphopentane phosphatase